MLPRSSGVEGSKVFPISINLEEYKKVELSALQCLRVSLCGNFRVRVSSSCDFQSWLKFSVLDPASAKELKLPKKLVWFKFQLTAQSFVLKQAHPAHPPPINSTETSPGKLCFYNQILDHSTVKYSPETSPEYPPFPWTKSLVLQQHKVSPPRLHIILPLPATSSSSCCAPSPSSSSISHS
ncbi:hypothetical protein ILYODFUR_038877 [Ilyodon furcidens]|uniref:Uncharacterized protein n=1 Tax=Ilyodon furcidens TaxID=33524 RepID=A0ABV0UDA1_9TELE